MFREKLENIFIQNRSDLPFANYANFFNEIDGLDDIRKNTIKALQEYKEEYCT